MTTVSRSLSRRGQSVTLRRVPGDIEVTCMGFLRDFTSAPVEGGNPQGWSELRISNDEIAAAGWPGPPRKPDRVIADGKTRMVESCETRRKGAAIAMHVLRLSGG